MDKFKKYAEILKNFSKDMEMWKACEEDEIADAKEKYTSKALPEQLEKIKSVWTNDISIGCFDHFCERFYCRESM